MPKSSIGKLINQIRTEKNITLKWLCDGLCSMQKLSNIEADKNLLDVFLFECIVQRLGMTPDDFETVLYDEEYWEITQRDCIEQLLENGQIEEAKSILDSYRSYTKENRLTTQYCNQIEAVLAGLRNEHAYAIACVKKALLAVHSNVPITIRDEVLLSTRDIELCCMLAEEYLITGAEEKARGVLEYLISYVERHEIQDMELIKTYPKLAYLFSMLAQDKKSKLAAITMGEKAFHLLIVNDSTVFLAEIMELLIREYHNLGLENRAIRLERQLESLAALYQEFGGCQYATKGSLKWFKESYRKEYQLCKEMIRGERLARGIKREALIEGIYEDPETLARIENGSQNPSHKSYALLMKRLGLPAEKYSCWQVIEGIETLQCKEQITQKLIEHDYEGTKMELEKLKLLVPEEDYMNKQYIMREEAYVDYRIKQIDIEAFTRKEKAALECTYAGRINDLTRIPTLEEVKAFNYLALAYRKGGREKECLSLYEKLLACYHRSAIRDSYHYRALTLLNRNYLLHLEEMGQNDEALGCIEDVMRLEMMAGRGHGLDYICSELMCIYEQMPLDEDIKKKATERYLRLAFYLSDLFMKKANNTIADKYYKGNFDSNVKWYE